MATLFLTHNFETSEENLKVSDAVDISGVDKLTLSAKVTGAKETQRFDVVVLSSADGTNYDMLRDEFGQVIQFTIIGNNIRKETLAGLNDANLKVQVYSKHLYGTIAVVSL